MRLSQAWWGRLGFDSGSTVAVLRCSTGPLAPKASADRVSGRALQRTTCADEVVTLAHDGCRWRSLLHSCSISKALPEIRIVISFVTRHTLWRMGRSTGYGSFSTPLPRVQARVLVHADGTPVRQSDSSQLRSHLVIHGD
jgi:hypothetical protein